jgi:nucleotidyltransferase/DNA polymerase involved in DNA repair
MWLLEQLHSWSPWLASPGIGRAWLIVSAAEARQLPREFRAQAGTAAYREVALAAALSSEPGQLRSVEAGLEQAFLDQLPVRNLRGLGLSGRTVQRLEYLGISRAGELRKWREPQVRAVLGEETSLILPVLTGPWSAAVPLYQPERSFSCSHGFTDPATEPWQVEPVILQLAWRLSQRLGSEAASRVTVTTESSGLQLQHETIPKNPVSRPDVLARLLQRSLGRTGALSLGIDRLSVRLHGLAVRQVQPGLWPQRQARQQAIRAVSRRFPGALLAYRLLDPHSLARDQRYRLIRLDSGTAWNQDRHQDREKQKVRPENAVGTATGFPAGRCDRETTRTAA